MPPPNSARRSTTMMSKGKKAKAYSNADSLDEGYGGPAAFPADLCDVTGVDCGPDGSPPRNATVKLSKTQSSVGVVQVDGDVGVYDYDRNETSVLKDDSISG
jgi:hypothetical protein